MIRSKPGVLVLITPLMLTPRSGLNTLLAAQNIPITDGSTCHPSVNSCDRCHAKGKPPEVAYSVAEARKNDTCLACHGREKFAAKLDADAGVQDVHAKAGLGCVDCHGVADLHGDGTPYASMKCPGAIKASCNFCHGKSAAFNPDIRAHKIHAAKLDCAACHVSSTMNCYNCHFSEALRTGQRAGNFIPLRGTLLLVNYRGKVTAGGVQTLVWKGKPFIAYAPQFTHSVTAKGRGCAECHANEAVKLMMAGKSVPVVGFENGKATAWKGVVPALPERLEWVYLDKKGGQWVPIKAKAKEQWAGFATPMREDQLKRLANPMTE